METYEEAGRSGSCEKVKEKLKGNPEKGDKQTTLLVAPALRTHKWIYWHRRAALWHAKLPNGTTFCDPSHDGAVQRTGKILGKHPDSFRLRSPHAQDISSKGSKGESAQYHLRRLFRMIWSSYRQGPRQGKHRFACLPADAAYTYKYF